MRSVSGIAAVLNNVFYGCGLQRSFNMNAAPDKHGLSRRGRHAAPLLFARNFFRHPRMLGSIVPSSRFLINQLLEPVHWRRASVIVEYGPGVGDITAEVLRNMRRDATLIAIETNTEFAAFLRTSFDDDRFHVVEASAERIDDILREYGHKHASYIISGIPFSTMPASSRDRILRRTYHALDPRGMFLVYQFSSRVLPELKKIFPYVGRKFEPLNILPAHLFFCRREAASPVLAIRRSMGGRKFG